MYEVDHGALAVLMSVAVALRSLSYIAVYAIGMHAIRFGIECVYAYACAPAPSFTGFVSSFVVANSDLCVALRHSSGFTNDLSALAIMGAIHTAMRALPELSQRPPGARQAAAS